MQDNQQQEQQSPQERNKKFQRRLVNLFSEIHMLNEDVKEIKAEMKENAVDKEQVSSMVKLARAQAKDSANLQAVLQKAKSLLETSEEVL